MLQENNNNPEQKTYKEKLLKAYDDLNKRLQERDQEISKLQEQNPKPKERNPNENLYNSSF